jgi:hypothetical protein
MQILVIKNILSVTFQLTLDLLQKLLILVVAKMLDVIKMETYNAYRANVDIAHRNVKKSIGLIIKSIVYVYMFTLLLLLLLHYYFYY